MEAYNTIKKNVGPHIVKEKGSKFLGYAYPVDSEEDCKEIIETLWKKYPDATHVCYAYTMGVDSEEVFRLNDDGEPHNSAAMPIYNQIQSAQLAHVLVAVVRYYGGTKLGVGGLIQAYKITAKETLELVHIVRYEPMIQVRIAFQYEQTSEITKLLHGLPHEILSKEFSERCIFVLKVPEKHQHTIEKTIQHLPIEYVFL